jgi:DNA helicase-2/ATP-dependent DNA helicase PcrA
LDFGFGNEVVGAQFIEPVKENLGLSMEQKMVAVPIQDLNKEQKEAVTHKGRPLLLLGPAGSGKSEVLKRKIGYLLSSGIASPEKILVFTDQEEMVDGLRLYLQPGYGEFWVNSFTAFCKRVLRQNYSRVPGIYPNFQVLDGLEERLVLSKIIKGLRLHYYRRVQHTSGFLDEVVDFIDLLKLNPQVNLPDYGKFRDLKRIYGEYQDFLHRENRLDFRDLVLKTIQLFNSHPNILENYRERFSYILLDDFQNIDLNQYALFSLLAQGKQEVFFSGNEEESVFRFRGALPYEVKGRFLREFAPNIISLSKLPTSSPGITLVRCNNGSEEALFIARKVYGLSRQGYHYRDIAILCRGVSREIKNLEDALKIYGIDYTVMGGIAFFKQPEIVQIISILKCIGGVKEEMNTHLLRALAAPEFKIDPVDIQRLFTYSERKGMPFLSVIRMVVKELPLDFSDEAESGISYPGWGLKEDTVSSLREFLSAIEDMERKAKEESLERLIYRVFLRFGYLKAGTKNRRLAKNLSYFLEVVKKFQKIENNLSFFDFMAYLDEMLASYGRDEAITFIPQEDSVQIMTVQRASGEFFPVVFVTGLVEGKFPRDLFESSLLSLGERKRLGLEPLPELCEHLKEEERIFNLAISRARERLYLTYGKTYESNRDSLLSSFVLKLVGAEKEDELLEKCRNRGIEFLDKPSILGPEEKDEILTREDLINFWLTTGNKDLESLLEEMDREKYKEIMRIKEEFSQEALWDKVKIPPDYSFSSYKLESYSECPAKFFFSSILKIWIKPKPALIFGRLLHRILASFHEKYNSRDALDSSQAKEDMEKEIEKVFSEEGGSFSTLFEKEVYQRLCSQILLRYLEKERERESFSVREIEREINWRINGLNFSGRIDRLDRLEGGFEEVIDYKTSKNPFMEFSLCRKISQGESFQLPIYFFGVREDLKRPVERLSIYWLRKDLPNPRANIKATIEMGKQYSNGGVVFSTAESLKQALNHLKEKAKKILEGYYPQKPRNCWNCDFKFLCDEKIGTATIFPTD